MSDQKKIDQPPYIYRSEIPKPYVTGAFGGFTPHDFRIMFFSEVPYSQDQILPAGDMKVIREVQCEITMSPLAAKELVIWLQKKIDNFEETLGEIKLPSTINPKGPNETESKK